MFICSGSNIDFKKLRYISNTTDKNELFLSVTIPEKIGSFYNLYKLIFPNNVTEFSYRNKKTDTANIYVSIETEDSYNIIKNIKKNNLDVINLNNNNFAKEHIRYLIGGKINIKENIYIQLSRVSWGIKRIS